MLLAERLRRDEEKVVVASVLEKHVFGAASSKRLGVEDMYYGAGNPTPEVGELPLCCFVAVLFLLWLAHQCLLSGLYHML